MTIVSADLCPPPPGVGDVHVDAILLSSAGAAVARATPANVGLDGSWVTRLVIPEVSPGTYTVAASCVMGVPAAAYTQYRPEPWRVAGSTVPRP